MAVTRMLVLLLVIVLVAPASAVAMSASACKEERRLLINACKAVLYGRVPSPECCHCQRLRVTHWDCVCPIITTKLAPLIDVNRAVRLIEGCGRRVPRRSKCGSITTP